MIHTSKGPPQSIDQPKRKSTNKLQDVKFIVYTNKTKPPKAVHEDFTCHLCSKVFITKDSLLNHEESVHAEKFNSKIRLESHFAKFLKRTNIIFSLTPSHSA